MKSTNYVEGFYVRQTQLQFFALKIKVATNNIDLFCHRDQLSCKKLLLLHLFLTFWTNC